MGRAGINLGVALISLGVALVVIGVLALGAMLMLHTPLGRAAVSFIKGFVYGVFYVSPLIITVIIIAITIMIARSRKKPSRATHHQ